MSETTQPRKSDSSEKTDSPPVPLNIEMEAGAISGGKMIGVEAHHVEKMYAERVVIDAGQAAAPPTEGEPPYKGLDFYDVADAPRFFGREKLTAELVAFVREHAFLAIIGASGSGKSSIARAGLVASLLGVNPRPLEDGVQPPLGSFDWRHVAVIPTAAPFEALARGLAGGGGDAVALKTALEADPQALRERIPALAGKGDHLLLLVDQFEEIFTLCKDEQKRRGYIAALLAACSGPDAGGAGAPCTLILAMRADFYSQCGHYEQLRAALETHQKYIGPMNRNELQRTIELPAQAGGWAFQQGLVEQILGDVGTEPGQLPLLSYALLETWKRRSGRVMTLAGYQAAGRVDEAISQTAESVYAELDRQELGEVARRIFLSLVELGDEGRATRRREPLAVLAPGDSGSPKAKTLQALSAQDARLVTVDGEVVQISHEALIGAWPRLVKWLSDYRDDLRLLDGIRDAAAAWRAAPAAERDNLLVHRGGRLEDALKLHSAGQFDLSTVESAYLDDCMALRDREREAERQRQEERVRAAETLAQEQQLRAEAESERANERDKAARRLRLRNRVLMVVGAIALVAAGFAILQMRIAQQRALMAHAGEVTARAQAEVRSNVSPDAAALLAIETVAMSRQSYGYVTDGASAAMIMAAEQLPPWQLTLPPSYTEWTPYIGVEDQIKSTAFSLDGKWVVTVGDAGRGDIWDATNGTHLEYLKGHSGTIFSVVLSQDGRRLLTASTNGPAIVWDTATRQAYRTLRGPTGVLMSAAFSPDGRQVVTSREDGTVILWDVETGNRVHVLRGHSDQVLSARYSPDGRWVVSASADKTAILWDAGSGEPLHQLTGHTGKVYRAEFRPDGQQLVTASADGTARIWDPQSGATLHTLVGHSDEVWSATYSPDGQWLVTISKDATAVLWEAATGRMHRQLSDHRAAITCAAFSPDSRWVVTGAYDSVAYLWDVATGEPVRKLSGHKLVIRSVAFSADGRWLVTASGDETARIWDVGASDPLPILVGHRDVGLSADFSPDGSRLATGSSEGAPRLWDAHNGALLYTLRHSGAGDARAAFSPDGRWVLSYGQGKARVWNSANGQVRYTLERPTDGEADDVSHAFFSPDSQLVLTVSYGGAIRRWSVASGELLDEYWSLGISPLLHLPNPPFNDRPCSTCIILTPDNRLVIAVNEGRFSSSTDTIPNAQLVHISWSTDVGTELLVMAAMSPDGKWFAASTNSGRLNLWDVASDTLRFSSTKPQGYPLAFSPDARQLAIASQDGTVRLVDPSTGKATHELIGHSGLVPSAVFSQDGRFLVTSGASKEKVARVWDTSTGKQEIALDGHSRDVTSAVFSPDGIRVATTSIDGTARIWLADIDELIRVVRARVQRLQPELTPDERKNYGLD